MPRKHAQDVTSLNEDGRKLKALLDQNDIRHTSLELEFKDDLTSFNPEKWRAKKPRRRPQSTYRYKGP